MKEQLDKCDIEIAEWNEMNELFSKTLRYNLLETLIPHINRSIQFFINKLEQNYKIEYDNLYNFSINYENMKEYATEHFSPFEDYDGEDDWSQDGYMR